MDGCRPQAKWCLRLLESQLTGRHQIEIRFRTRDGRSQILKVDNSRRSDFDFVRRELDALNARLPTDRKEAIAFVEELVRSTPTAPIIACASPGFCNHGKGFVMPCRRYGDARGEFVWDATNAQPDFGAIRGDLRNYSRNVLRPALSSPYLTFAILTPLASALLGYVFQRGGRQLSARNRDCSLCGRLELGEDHASACCTIGLWFAERRNRLRGV